MKYKFKNNTSAIGQVLDTINNIKVGDKVLFNDEKNGRSGHYIIKGVSPILDNDNKVFFYYSTTGGHFDCSHLVKGGSNE